MSLFKIQHNKHPHPSSLNEFRETFRTTVKLLSEGLKTPASLNLGEKSDILVIQKQNPNGFDIILECFDYGVYPSSSKGWHGGCWDVTVFKSEDLSQSLTEFISSVLEDAILNVSYSNQTPYKWSLQCKFEDKRLSDETGLLLYNWFGKRTTKSYCNG